MISFTRTQKYLSTSYCVDYSDFEKKNTDTLSKHAPKKIKILRGNQKPHINETLRKTIMKRSQLKNNANKTRNATDGSHYKSKETMW